MVNITIYRDRNRIPVGFETSGHAEYDEEGQDIVCAAISVLTINTVNSIEKLTESAFTCQVVQETGSISFRLKEQITESGSLLLRSMILGLEEIRNSYGEEFLQINYREV